MKIKLNNKEVETSASTLQELLDEKEISTTGIALAVNAKVVSRSLWAQTPLNEADELVVVSAVYGG